MLSVLLQETWNTLKMTKKGTVQWTGSTNTADKEGWELQMCTLWSKFTWIGKEEPHKARPRTKELANWWKGWFDEKGKRLPICDSCSLDPALIHTINQNTNSCDSYAFLFTVICFCRGPAPSNKDLSESSVPGQHILISFSKEIKWPLLFFPCKPFSFTATSLRMLPPFP